MYNQSKISAKPSKPRINFESKSLHSGSKSSQDIFDFTVTASLAHLYCSKSSPQNINAPIIKERLTNGYRIVDLGLDHMEDALKLIKTEGQEDAGKNGPEEASLFVRWNSPSQHYIKTDPLCNSIGLSTDPDSLRTLDYIILKKIGDWCSLCAIEEGSGKLVGVIIGSLKTKNDQERTETRIRSKQGKGLFYLLTLNSCLISKSQIYERLDVDNYFRIYVLCVKTEHRRKGIGLALVRNFVDKSKDLKKSACVGVFISGAALTIGRKLGFEYLGDIFLEDALVPEDDYYVDFSVKKFKLFCMALYNKIPLELAAPTDTITVQNSTPRSNKQKKESKNRK